MKEIRQILRAYDIACQKGQRVALATVVHVDGSSYRGPGARMLVSEDGTLTGAISGGCLEGDALRKALMAIAEQRPLLATYDTSDDEDAIFGMGLGCNGIIRILIEPINTNDDANPIELLRKAADTREPSVIVTFFSLDDKWNPLQGTYLLMKNNKMVVKSGALPLSIDIFLHDINKTLEHKHTYLVKYNISTTSSNHKELTAIFEYLAPDISLVIAGAGNDVFPLIDMAEVLGWQITLIDGRPAYATASRFPSCHLIVADADKALHEVLLDDRTAVILMTHNYQYDKSLLNSLLSENRVPYIGMLGPKKKKHSMLTELREAGAHWQEEALIHLYSPMGLNIGAETPEEIALSVIAEIKAIFARRDGGSLRDYPGKIHNRNDEIVISDNKQFIG